MNYTTLVLQRAQTWRTRWARRRSAARHHPAAMLLAVLALALLVLPLAADGQTGRVYRVGLMTTGTTETTGYVETFRGALRALGYVEGSNLILEVRLTNIDNRPERDVAKELIAHGPDVLVGWESLAQLMCAQTDTIPIVLAGGIDPVGAGLAQSLRRPGLNVTGAVQLNGELAEKHVDIVREIIPRITRVGLIVDQTASTCRVIEEHARRATLAIGAAFVAYPVRDKADVERAFVQMEKERPDVLLPCPSTLLFHLRPVLFENATRLQIPFTSFVTSNVPGGVLFAYATDLHEIYRAAARYVDKILRGARAADLPIEQPVKFELVINQKTARAYGIRVPQSVLLRADRVVE